MLFNKQLKNTILNITLLFILAYLIYIQSNQSKYSNQSIQSIQSNQSKYSNQSIEPFDYFTCTMNLQDIDHRFVNEYMKYDGRHVPCGQCKNSTLRMNISTCPTNANGSSSDNCKQNGNIESSQGNNIIFPNRVTIENIKTFFCFDE